MSLLAMGTMLTLMSPSPAGADQSNNSVNMAEQSGGPYYIFPVDGAADDQGANTSFFQWLMWSPLYRNANGGSGAGVGVDEPESLAELPTYSVQDGHDVVTINLKKLDWSDGTPVTTRDVQFFFDLARANEDSYGAYVPGEFPANVTSVGIISPTQMQFVLNGVYNPTWFTNEELTNIIPIPQHVWDKTSESGAVGNYDVNSDGSINTAGAQAVFKFLSTEGSNIGTFTTNPLWKTIDGPWMLQSVVTQGPTTFVPNPKYDGTQKARLSSLTFTPYTSPDAEFSALQAGQVDFGLVPTQDIGTIPSLKSSGFTVTDWYEELLNGVLPNLNNPKVGMIFRQVYIRQAMQLLMDQKGIIRAVDQGPKYATTACGPTPARPAVGDLTSLAEHCPWNYNPQKAINLLKSHGWHVVPNGTTTCAKPGTGAGDCGQGIAKGAKLQFTLLYYQGYSDPIDIWKSGLSLAGIELTLKSSPIGTVYAATLPCTAQQSSCSWQMNEAGWIFGTSAYPSGGEIYSPHGAANKESWVNAKAGQLINAVTTAPNLAAEKSAYSKYENYIVEQTPQWLLPEVPFQIAAVRSSLKGVKFGPNPNPDEWHYAK
jgi:peptide/nickel transport system substrate-binding protein